MGSIHVVGHLNPDTDAIASAMGYAWYRSNREGEEVVASRAGPLNSQTAWVLELLELKPPEFLGDASPRFEAVARRFDSVTPDRPLQEAWMIANRTGTVAPVVDEEGKPYGLISGFSLFRTLSQSVGQHPIHQDMRLSELFDMPSGEAADREVPKFQSSSRIRDALPTILRAERNDFWVVDAKGYYVGVCRQRDLLNPPRLRLILVDHNEVGQSVGSLDEADLLEVLDHHRLDNPPTRLPIRFRVDPVGSTSTLVAERILDAGLSAPPALAGLLLAGVLSDTLLLTSPTTTDRDRATAETLGRWAFVGGSPLDGKTIESFGKALLQAGAGLRTRNANDVVAGDLKMYESAGLHFGISQVEVTDLVGAEEYLTQLGEALEDFVKQRGQDFAVLMITDIVEGSSRILMRCAPPILSELPYKLLSDGSLEARGMVSRKKQLLPVILALLES
ncbi:MAG: CBS domain-containing protein [Anaerolineales bacterium]|nr:MAG: CBS domain-containing protein [Anaerolineales bacterium]